MNPRLLFWLSLTALATLVVSIVAPSAPIIGCLAANDATPAACGTTIVVAVFVATWLILVGGLLATAAWVIGLVFAAQREEWGWFAAILFLSPIATLIYSRRLAPPIGPHLGSN